MKKVEGFSSLYKKSDGAVVNTDMSAYHAAKKRKQEKQRLNNVEDRLERIEQLLERLLNVHKV